MLSLSCRYSTAVQTSLLLWKSGNHHDPTKPADSLTLLLCSVLLPLLPYTPTNPSSQAEDIAQGFEHGPVPPLKRGVGPLKPRVPPAAAAAATTDSTSGKVTVRTEAAERAASLWPILRQLLRCVCAFFFFLFVVGVFLVARK